MNNAKIKQLEKKIKALQRKLDREEHEPDNYFKKAFGRRGNEQEVMEALLRI